MLEMTVISLKTGLSPLHHILWDMLQHQGQKFEGGRGRPKILLKNPGEFP